jgi:hypothetical protein
MLFCADGNFLSSFFLVLDFLEYLVYGFVSIILNFIVAFVSWPLAENCLLYYMISDSAHMENILKSYDLKPY